MLSGNVASANRYAGTIVSWHDGDTGHISVYDPALGVPVILTVRLLGINAPELTEPGGREVTAALSNLLPPGRAVILTGLKPDKYGGRADAAVQSADGTDVSSWLLSRGYAVPWTGVGPKPSVPWPPIKN